MTPVFCCGFECGVIGVSTPGQHIFSSNSSGTASIDTTIKRSGARSLKVVTELAETFFATAAAVKVVRAYVYFATLPNDHTAVLYAPVGSGRGIWFNVTDSKLYTGSATSTYGATGYTVTTGRWYRLDLRIDGTNNPWLIDAQVDGNPLGQLSVAVAGGTTGSVRMGGQAHTESYFDDLIISHTTGDYPIGNGYVNHFIPTSDGTHNIAGTADFTRTLTGTDILNATTTAFQLVDDVPLESGASVDWINMLAPPNATDYVECIFGPASGIKTPTYGPRAVEVIAGIHHAGTGTGNMEIRLNDNGSMGTIYTATGVAGSTTVIYKRAHFSDPPSAASVWGVAAGNGNFNNVRFRFGSPAAVDANPDQYLDCIMIEAEFAEAPQRITNITQAVNRANSY